MHENSNPLKRLKRNFNVKHDNVDDPDFDNDYEREKYLAKKYEEQIRQRQREELLGITHEPDKKPLLDFDELNSKVTSKFSASDKESSNGSPEPSNYIVSSINPHEVEEKPKKSHWALTSSVAEKAASLLTSQLLESIRLSALTVTEMQEHPQVDEYLSGCLVKTPIPLSINRYQTKLCRILNLDYSSDELKCCVVPLDSSEFYTIRTIDILDSVITDEDVRELREVLLKNEVYHDFLISLPNFATKKAAQLCKFTYTEADVNKILQNKKQKRSKPINTRIYFKELYHKSLDYEAQIAQLESCLTKTDSNQTELRNELERVKEQLSQVKREMDELQGKIRKSTQPLTPTVSRLATDDTEYDDSCKKFVQNMFQFDLKKLITLKQTNQHLYKTSSQNPKHILNIIQPLAEIENPATYSEQLKKTFFTVMRDNQSLSSQILSALTNVQPNLYFPSLESTFDYKEKDINEAISFKDFLESHY